VHGVAVFSQDREKQLETSGLIVDDENAALVVALVRKSRKDLRD
jgi:hypothetical protein